MIERICVGDWVDIFFEHCEPILWAKILYQPISVGETYIVKQYKGTVFEIQTFCYMKKVTSPERNSV